MDELLKVLLNQGTPGVSGIVVGAFLAYKYFNRTANGTQQAQQAPAPEHSHHDYIIREDCTRRHQDLRDFMKDNFEDVKEKIKDLK